MPTELVFRVDGSSATPAAEISLSEAGLREREHLQEWVLQNPSILGDDVLIVSTEFDRWIGRTGTTPLDRLDILGLDRSGRLLVAELKRDRAPETVDMQALKYAAFVSRFTLDALANAFAHYMERYGGEAGLSMNDALGRLQLWAPDLSDETLRSPRICLIASDFPPSVTATTVFLHENGLDIRLVRIQAYRTRDDTVVTVSQLWPLATVEEFTISPRSSSQAQQQVQRERRYRASVVDRLIESGAMEDGTPLEVVIPAKVGQDITRIQEWLDEVPSRKAAVWKNDSRQPVTWKFDDKPYSPTGLITFIIQEATQKPPQAQVWGPNWLRAPDGRYLHQLADAVDPG